MFTPRFSVTLDIQAARKSFAGEQKEVNKAAARALTRTTTSARKAADQTMRQRITLKSGVVKDAFEIVFPFGSRSLVRDLQVSGDPIPLRDWAARRTQRKGVTFAVVKGQRKAYMRRGRKSFIVERIGGHVFVRTNADPPGPAKAKIAKVFGPSLTQRFRTKQVQNAVMAAIRERWPIEFEREMNYRRSKL